MIDHYMEQAQDNARLAARYSDRLDGQVFAALAQAYATLALVEATRRDER